jgi:hypothetical protein
MANQASYMLYRAGARMHWSCQPAPADQSARQPRRLRQRQAADDQDRRTPDTIPCCGVCSSQNNPGSNNISLTGENGWGQSPAGSVARIS